MARTMMNNTGPLIPLTYRPDEYKIHLQHRIYFGGNKMVCYFTFIYLYTTPPTSHRSQQNLQKSQRLRQPWQVLKIFFS